MSFFFFCSLALLFIILFFQFLCFGFCWGKMLKNMISEKAKEKKKQFNNTLSNLFIHFNGRRQKLFLSVPPPPRMLLIFSNQLTIFFPYQYLLCWHRAHFSVTLSVCQSVSPFVLAWFSRLQTCFFDRSCFLRKDLYFYRPKKDGK